MIYILGIVGSMIDSLFITMFYHIKYPIKKYGILISTLSIIIFLSWFLPQTIFTKALLFMVFYIICMIFQRKKFNIFYIIIPCLLLGSIQTILSFVMEINLFYHFANWLIEMFIIFVLHEDKSYKFEFKFLSITVKIFVLLSILMLLCLSKYIYELR